MSYRIVAGVLIQQNAGERNVRIELDSAVQHFDNFEETGLRIFFGMQGK